jgi:hypothetical protein
MQREKANAASAPDRSVLVDEGPFGVVVVLEPSCATWLPDEPPPHAATTRASPAVATVTANQFTPSMIARPDNSRRSRQ